jgi:AraC-like DNA-binding protein
MSIIHDQASGTLGEASETHATVPLGNFDPLSDVLRTVKLRGALFFMIDATSPWCVEVPHARDYADIILPSARHIVSYHVVVEGQGLASVPGVETIAFDAGDIIVFPHSDPYLMLSAAGVQPDLNREQTLQFFRDAAAGKLPFVIPEGGGNSPKAKFICGFLGCDLSPFNPLLATLPLILHIRRPNDGHLGLLDQLIDLAMTEIRTPHAGGESIRLSLCELMFVELLRRHLETLSSDEPGWLAGLRDPKVGRALAVLHAEPSRDWTLDALARATGVSRSVLAERFARCVGETPMRYLTLWRMQLAARMLVDGATKVAAIGEQVGFRSESAFSRTFKKVTGLSPTEWRRAPAIPLPDSGDMSESRHEPDTARP